VNRTIKAFIFLILLFASKSMMAQGQVVPDGILFQAVARDANNNAAGNRNIYIQIYIKKGTVTGSTEYSESFKVVSNTEGIFSIIIGQGTRMSGPASLKLLDWAKSMYFVNIKIAIEPTLTNPDWKADNNYADIGTSQLWTVPYSFTSETSKYADSSGTIASILPGAKGGTGVANTGKTITVANNLITKGVGDLTITTTAASNVIFPTSGTLVSREGVDSLFNKTLMSAVLLGKPIAVTPDSTSADSSVATTYFVSQKVNKLISSSTSLTVGKVNVADTAAMLLPYAIRSNTEASINTEKARALAAEALKVNIADTSAMLSARIARDTVSLSNRIEDLTASTRAATNLKVNIADTSAMLSARIARDTVSLSNRIEDLTASTHAATNLKVNIADTAAMLLPYAIRSNTEASINTEKARALAAEALKVNIADTSAMLTARIARDTISLSARIDARELLTNKSTSVITDSTSDTKYPSVKSVVDYIGSSITSAATPDATTTIKGKIQLAGDLGGTAASPTVSKVGGVSAATIASLPGLITTNTTDIATNLAKQKIDSSFLRGLINNNLSSINTNLLKQQTDSATLATKIRTDSTDLLAKIVSDSTVLRGLINTNSNDITTNTNNIANNSISISQNATNIAANTLAINNRVSFSDMPTYLSPYLKIADTLGMLANYRASMIDNDYKIAALIADTATLITRFSYKENISNKSTDVLNDGNSTVKYPTVKSVKDYVDNAITTATPDATTTVKGKIQLAGDLTGIAAAPTVNSVGGSSSSTINTATLLANAATDANTVSTIVKRDASGNFNAGTITASLTGNVTGNLTGNVTGNVTGNSSTATKLAATKSIYGNAFDGSVDLTQAIAGTYGGTGVNNGSKTITLGGNILTASDFITVGNYSTTLTSTGATNITLPLTGILATLAGTETLTNKTITDVVLTGTPVAPTASAGSNSSQVATTAFVTAANISAATPDATSTVKGKIQLAGDLGGIAEAPTVNTVGGSSSSTINTATLLANAATDANTISTIVKRDMNGDFSARNITANLLGTATNVTGIVLGTNGGTGIDNTGKTISLGGNINTGKNFTTTGVSNSGADITLKTTNNTIITLPTAGTLSTLAGTEALTNKTINDLTLSAATTGFSIAGGSTNSKTLTLSGDATISGNNTGDQNIVLTGDVTGIGTGTFSTTLASSGVTSGVYGGATSVPTITIDSKGRITNATSTPIIGVSSIGSYLESGKIIVGDFNNQAAKVDMVGDIVIDNIGTTSIVNNKITTSKILNENVTYAKIQQVSATNKILGRVSAGAGIIEEIATTGTGNVVRAISPTFTGAPQTPTPVVSSNDQTVANTEFVTRAIGNINASSVSGVLPAANGGTGIDNTGKTITLGGNLDFAKGFTTTGTNISNASDITFKTTGNTILTLPTSGTVATLSDVSASSIGGNQITGIIYPINGGTGVANDNTNIITLGGSITTGAKLTTTGTTGLNASDITFKTTAASVVVLPTTGTLATLAGAEVLTNKTIDASSNTISNISNANIAASAAIADTKLATISTAGKVDNAATTATIANTANSIVLRDVNGAFSAGSISASLNGNAATATRLATARSVYGNTFDGTADLAQIIGTAFGGTGNGFTKFIGPSTSEKVFTLPDASATILTTNALVSVAQGGTGAATATQNFIFAGPATGSSAGAPSFRALTAADLPAGSGSYIANSTTLQSSANFNISGNGTAGGNITAASFIVPTASSTQFLKGDGSLDATTYATAGANSNITSLTGLTTALSIAQGGTGSATKNFVDLTTAQSIGGAKTFTSAITAPSLKITTGATNGYVLTSAADGTATWAAPGLSGSGTSNYIPKYNGSATALGNSKMFDDGTSVMVNTATSSLAGGSTFLTSNGTNGVPATSGATQTYGALRIRGGDNTVIDFGTVSTKPWIQSGDLASLATSYPLYLNPNGGNIGIGLATSATVSEKLEVSGNIKASGTIRAGAITYPSTHNSIANQVLTVDASGNTSWVTNMSGVTSVSGGTTGLTPATATTGAITLAGTLNVANGGTGASTLTANAVLVGNGTGAVQSVAPGTLGNVLVSNGTNWVSQAAPASGVSVVGAISASSNVKGATISGTTITLTPADATNGGIVTASAQTFAGTKSFADVVLSGALTGGSSATSTLAGFNAAITAVSSSVTISAANAATYNGKVLVCSGGSITITFDSTVPTGFSCMILQSDTNTINFSGTNNRYNYTSTSGIYAIATAMCYSSGSVLLTGDLQ